MTSNDKKPAIVPHNPFGMKTKTVAPTEDDGFLWLPGWTVTVQEIPYVEQQDLLMAGVSEQHNLPTSKEQIKDHKLHVFEIDNRKGALAQMKAGIASWTFMNEKDQIVPVTDLALEKLSGRDGEFIMEAIKELNPQMEDVDDFPGDVGDDL